MICWTISGEDISRKVASYRGNNLIGRHCVQHYDEIWSGRGEEGCRRDEKGSSIVGRVPGVGDYYTLLIVDKPLPCVCFLVPRNNTRWKRKENESHLVSMATGKLLGRCYVTRQSNEVENGVMTQLFGDCFCLHHQGWIRKSFSHG